MQGSYPFHLSFANSLHRSVPRSLSLEKISSTALSPVPFLPNLIVVGLFFFFHGTRIFIILICSPILVFSTSLISFIFVTSFLVLSVDLLSLFFWIFQWVVHVFVFLLIYVFLPINMCSKKDIPYCHNVVLFLYVSSYIVYILTKDILNYVLQIFFVVVVPLVCHMNSNLVRLSCI